MGDTSDAPASETTSQKDVVAVLPAEQVTTTRIERPPAADVITTRLPRPLRPPAVLDADAPLDANLGARLTPLIALGLVMLGVLLGLIAGVLLGRSTR